MTHIKNIRLCQELGHIINAYKMKLWEMIIFVGDENIDSCIISFKPTEEQLAKLTPEGVFTSNDAFFTVEEFNTDIDPVQYKSHNLVIDNYNDLDSYIDQAYEQIFDVAEEDIIGWEGMEGDFDIPE